MLRRDLQHFTRVVLGDAKGDGGREIAGDEGLDTDGFDGITGGNEGVIGLVGEPEREDTLFLCGEREKGRGHDGKKV